MFFPKKMRKLEEIITARPKVLLFPDLDEVPNRPALFDEIEKKIGETFVYSLSRSEKRWYEDSRLRSYYELGRDSYIILINEDGVRLRQWVKGRFPTVQNIAEEILEYGVKWTKVFGDLSIKNL